MIDAFWIPLLPPYLIGLVLSWSLEILHRPQPVAPWRRPPAVVAVHVGVWTLLFALELALFRRPYFGMANVLAMQLLIVLVSNAKFHALREPFVYPDFEYFADALRHPRLYLPFFGVGRAIAAGGGYGVALWAGLALEDSVTAGAGVWLVSFADLPQEHMFDPTAPAVPFFAHTLGLAVAGLLLALLAGRRNHVSFDAASDLQRFGMIASLWAYGCSERRRTTDQYNNAPFAAIKQPAVIPDTLPDLVALQSESFFDARRAYPQLLREDVLENFDALKVEAVAHGGLNVAAWGANTVRTEFAFLAGMSGNALGVHQYNPYRKLAKKGFPTIASYLRTLGYRTVCVHPYHRSFYQRDKVLPLLGFDEFIGIEAFEQAQRDGPYVGDRSLAEWILNFLQEEGGRPLYLHVITMENHGPLHWEQISMTDTDATLKSSLPAGCEELVAYARHLRNADAMFSLLHQGLRTRSRQRPAGMCIFGDHVPIMSGVYKNLGPPDGPTDYLIWKSEYGDAVIPQCANVQDLALMFLDAMRLSVHSSFPSQERGG